MSVHDYYEGTVVTVRPDCLPGRAYNGVFFSTEMLEFVGLRLIVTHIGNSPHYDDEIRLKIHPDDISQHTGHHRVEQYVWSPDMLRKVDDQPAETETPVERITPHLALIAFEITKLIPSRRVVRYDGGRADAIGAINAIMGGNPDNGSDDCDWIYTMWGRSYIAGFDAGYMGSSHSPSHYASDVSRAHFLKGRKDGLRVWEAIKRWRDDGYPPAKEWLECNMSV